MGISGGWRLFSVCLDKENESDPFSWAHHNFLTVNDLLSLFIKRDYTIKQGKKVKAERTIYGI